MDEKQRLTQLYKELSAAFPHPFDWVSGLRKPTIWRERRGHKMIQGIFEKHGFALPLTEGGDA